MRLTKIDLFVSKSSLLLKRAGLVLALQVDGMLSQDPWKQHGDRNTGFRYTCLIILAGVVFNPVEQGKVTMRTWEPWHYFEVLEVNFCSYGNYDTSELHILGVVSLNSIIIHIITLLFVHWQG
jgi:hypothetical protein